MQGTGVKYKVLTVPVLLKIPLTVKNHYTYCKVLPDAYITLGTVIRGDTHILIMYVSHNGWGCN